MDFTIKTLMDIYIHLQNFCIDFWDFMTMSINDFFNIDLGSIGDVNGAFLFFGGGIIVILGAFLVSIIIPN